VRAVGRPVLAVLAVDAGALQLVGGVLLAATGRFDVCSCSLAGASVAAMMAMCCHNWLNIAGIL